MFFQCACILYGCFIFFARIIYQGINLPANIPYNIPHWYIIRFSVINISLRLLYIIPIFRSNLHFVWYIIRLIFRSNLPYIIPIFRSKKERAEFLPLLCSYNFISLLLPKKSTKPFRLRRFRMFYRKNWCGAWLLRCNRSRAVQIFPVGFLRQWCYNFSAQYLRCHARLQRLCRRKIFCRGWGAVRKFS